MARTPIPVARSIAVSRVDLPGGTVLAVVDYAERWPGSALLALLTQMQGLHEGAGSRVRVLMLARSAGYWWPALADRAESILGIDTEQLALPPLAADSPDDRSDLFVAAANHFAAAMNIEPTDWVMPDLDRAEFTQVLAVHMAALAAVDAHRHGEAPPVRADLISAYLLRREQAYWYDRHTGPEATAQSPLNAMQMARVVYAATLLGPLTYDAALRVINDSGLGSPARSAVDVLDAHAALYPSSDVREVLQPLYPDRLGEDFLALQTPGHQIADYRPDPWTENAPVRFLTLADDEADLTTAHCLSRLIDVAQRWPHVGRLQLYPLLARAPQLVVLAGNAALSRVAAMEDADFEVLQTVALHLPEEPNFDIDVGAAALVKRVVEHHLTAEPSPEKAAVLLHWLASRMLCAGRRDEAVSAAARSVQHYRNLVTENASLTRDFSSALIDYAVALYETGCIDEAVAAAREVTALTERLKSSRSDVPARDFLKALSNLAALQHRNGQRQEAMRVAESVVRGYENLSVIEPDVDPRALPVAHTNLGMMLSDDGRHDEALGHTQKAAEMFGTLVERGLQQYLPDLADALSNLAGQTSEIGRVSEALRVADQALLIYQKLVKQNPAAYEPAFVRLRSNTAADLHRAGQHSEAFAAARAAADIYRRLPSRSPDGYEYVLAQVLSLVIRDLCAGEEPHDAVEAAQLAAEIYARIATYDATVYPHLFKALVQSIAPSGTVSAADWRELINIISTAVNELRNNGYVQEALEIEQLIEAADIAHDRDIP